MTAGVGSGRDRGARRSRGLRIAASRALGPHRATVDEAFVDLKLNEDGLPSEGEGLRSATLDLRAEPDTTLWKYLRDCLSQGLKSVTGT